MNTAIIPLLVRKDLLIMRKILLICCLISLTSIGVVSLLYGHISNWMLINIAFTLLLAPTATCGIVLLIKTNVFEKEKCTSLFIMSLPITVKEFTVAKLLVNLPVFGTMWLVTTGVAFYFSFGLSLFPPGTVPFITILFLGIFVAYTGILSVSMIFQSLGITVFSIMIFEMTTVIYMWVIAFLDPIANHVNGPNIVWNSTALSIVTVQVLAAICLVAVTVFVQSKKRDFI